MAQKISQLLPPVTGAYSEVTLTQAEINSTLEAAIAQKSKKQASEAENEEPVTLDELETEIALLEARQKKYGEIKRAEYLLKLNTKPSYPLYTAEEWFKRIQSEIVVDYENQAIIWQLCLYFTRDPRCEYNLDKGLGLFGPVGCGKTTLMRLFRNNQSNSYAVVSTRKISYDFVEHGFKAIERFNKLINASDPTKTWGQELIGVSFDDLGTEVEKKHFGNESNVMAEIILNRYDLISNDDDDKKKCRNKTHLTTNLSVDQLAERYGDRVVSRLSEMINQVTFNISCRDRRRNG